MRYTSRCSILAVFRAEAGNVLHVLLNFERKLASFLQKRGLQIVRTSRLVQS